MPPMPRYDVDGIVRAFKHHAVHGAPDFRYHGLDASGRHVRFRVTLRGEVLSLPKREAWLVALALAAGRDVGTRVADIVRDENAAVERGNR